MVTVYKLSDETSGEYKILNAETPIHKSTADVALGSIMETSRSQVSSDGKPVLDTEWPSVVSTIHLRHPVSRQVLWDEVNEDGVHSSVTVHNHLADSIVEPGMSHKC